MSPTPFVSTRGLHALRRAAGVLALSQLAAWPEAATSSASAVAPSRLAVHTTA